jgi:hypothetical protein
MDRRMFAYNPPVVVLTDPRGEVLEPDPFIPQGAERDGDLIRLPVVFPDGARVTLVYPIPLDLATLGVQPDVTYVFDGRYQGPIVFLHDRDASIRRFVEGTDPVALIDSYRSIEVWAARGNDVDRRFWVRLTLPSWTVLVPIEERGLAEEMAASLDVIETETGFPVIEASGDAELSVGFGEAGGAQLAFGDALAEPDMMSKLDAQIFLSPDGCTPATDSEFPRGYGSSCLGDGNLFASIYGDREFVTSVIDGLRVADFRPA